MSMQTTQDKPLTAKAGQSERCHNPLCQKPATLAGAQRYCDQECRNDMAALRRVGKRINGLADGEAIKIIREVNQ